MYFPKGVDVCFEYCFLVTLVGGGVERAVFCV